MSAPGKHFAGSTAPGELLRQVLSLPARYGELGITCPFSSSDHAYQTSTKISAPVCVAICLRSRCAEGALAAQHSLKREAPKNRQRDPLQVREELLNEASPDIHRPVNLGSERGAYVWLTALPIDSQGFWLHKGDFRNALCLRYGWPLCHLPTKCVCVLQEALRGARFELPTWGFPYITAQRGQRHHGQASYRGDLRCRH